MLCKAVYCLHKERGRCIRICLKCVIELLLPIIKLIIFSLLRNKFVV